MEPDRSIHTEGDTVTANLVQINVPQVDQQGASGYGVKVAVLDTGIATNSKELKVAGGADFVPDETTTDDLNGHGTHVAGILSAIQDNQGLVGVAPQAQLYAVKVLNGQGSGTYSQLIQGLEWAVDNKMDIVSMSLAGSEDSKALHQAVQTAAKQGVLLIAAAGNNGATQISYPAKYDEVVAVGAVDANNGRANFSNMGPELDLVAPGVAVQSLGLDGTYQTKSGTSMATPHIAGAAALVKSKHPTFTATQVRKQLEDTATSLGDPLQFGKGLVNVERALTTTFGTVPVQKENNSNKNKKSKEIISSNRSSQTQTVKPGGVATVSLELQQEVGSVEVTVMNAKNQKEVLVHETLPKQQANKSLTYSWQTSVDTQPGTYLIHLAYPDKKDSDDTFLVVVSNESKTGQSNATISAMADTITFDQNIHGDLNPYWWVDQYYKFTTDDLNSNIRLSLGGYTSDSYFHVEIHDENDVVVYSDEEYGWYDMIKLNPNSTYYLTLRGTYLYWDNDWSYDLMLSPIERYEENDTEETAASVSLNSTIKANGVSTTGLPDTDYYTYTTSYGGVMTIVSRDTDGFEVFTIDSDHNYISVGDTGGAEADGTATAVCFVSPNTKYYVHMYEPVTPYTLTIGDVIPDLQEPKNNTMSQALGLTVGTASDSDISYPGDQDYYTYTVSASNDQSITLDFGSDQAIKIDVLKADGTSYGTTRKISSTQEQIFVSANSNEKLYIRVYSQTYKYGLSYRLTVSNLIESYEPNSSVGTAYLIQPNIPYSSILGTANDVDWYKMTTSKTARYHISVQTPDINTFLVKVYDQAGKVVGSGKPKQGLQQEIEFSAQAGMIYSVQISDINGERTLFPYRLEVTESVGKYTYDPANRLTTYEVHRGLNNYRIDYNYDPNGHLLNKTKTNL